VDDPHFGYKQKNHKKKHQSSQNAYHAIFFFQFPQEGDWLPCYSSGMPCGVFILGFVNPIGYAKIN
jgi:hypothetical protein